MHSELDKVFEEAYKITAKHPEIRGKNRFNRIANMRNIYTFRKFISRITEKVEEALREGNQPMVIEIDIPELIKSDA